jgi:P2-related tail formation protein
MGIFSDYFFKTLRWPLAHRPGPLAVLVEGLARSLDEVRTDIIHLRNQFNPETCEMDLTPAHAESRGLTRHKMETDAQYARRCLRAYAWHRLGGGQLGMPRIFAALGYPGVTMRNVREDDPDRWAEFMPSVPVTDSGLAAGDYATIAQVANETKPARSLLAGIRATSGVPGGVRAGGIIYSTVRVRLMPERATTLNIIGTVYGGGYAHTVARTRI